MNNQQILDKNIAITNINLKDRASQRPKSWWTAIKTYMYLVIKVETVAADLDNRAQYMTQTPQTDHWQGVFPQQHWHVNIQLTRYPCTS